MISHTCKIADGVHISSGVNLAGNTEVGRASWIAMGATVIDPCHVGSGTLVGAGSLVTRNIPSGVVAYGVPARVVRPRRETVS
jgi:acetyltransferase-like isoleucine patch superfamily enzyme